MAKKMARSKGEGSLITRGKKKYFYLQYRINGKLTQVRLLDKNDKPITTKLEAAKAAKAVLAPLQESGTAKQLKAVKAKLEDEDSKRAALIAAAVPSIALSKVWIKYNRAPNRPRSGEATLKRYAATVKAFVKWVGETYPDAQTMRDIAAVHANGYAIHLEAKLLSPSSFNIYLNNLSTVWGVLAKEADIAENPFAWDKATRSGIPRKNIKAESNARKKRALTLDEVNKVIEQAEGDYRTLIIILTCTGQRLVDCVKLQWRSIDLKSGIIRLTPQKTAKRTGTEVLIPILPHLRAELESKARHDRYVLPELVDAYNRDPSAITKRMRNIFKDSGLQVHKEDKPGKKAIVEVGAHSFRHSFVSIARLAGVPDAIIQTITGHESVEMVDHYTAITPEAVKALSAAMKTTPQLPAKKREPMPDWIREKLETMTTENFKQVKADLLKRGK